MHARFSHTHRLVIAAVLLLIPAVGLSQNTMVTSSSFGTTSAGVEVKVFTMTNANGLQAKVIEYGATLVNLEVPDRDGTVVNIVRSYDDLNSYVQNAWTGSTVGRYANRIANAHFVLDGVEYNLTANSGAHQLHGGAQKGFHNVVWHGYPYKTDTEAGVHLTHLSLDGEEGFPGNLTCTVTYALTNENELRINYVATTDKPTVINMTNHSYFNLAGIGSGDILDHQLMINADWYTNSSSDLIPTGEIFSVIGSSGLDFRTAKVIGSQISKVNRQGQYDHNFVLNYLYGSITLAARVYEPTSGRVMECYTDQPGLQFYSADKTALALETQHFPDSPNKPHFPSTELRPDEKFESTTIYKFSTE